MEIFDADAPLSRRKVSRKSATGPWYQVMRQRLLLSTIQLSVMDHLPCTWTSKSSSASESESDLQEAFYALANFRFRDLSNNSSICPWLIIALSQHISLTLPFETHHERG